MNPSSMKSVSGNAISFGQIHAVLLVFMLLRVVIVAAAAAPNSLSLRCSYGDEGPTQRLRRLQCQRHQQFGPRRGPVSPIDTCAGERISPLPTTVAPSRFCATKWSRSGI